MKLEMVRQRQEKEDLQNALLKEQSANLNYRI
jgi:hypothetical protein